ncbi:GGDEF domain-containing protein [Acinetobacter sp. B51(2017)]|uniref:GGDEF domain-containing protein n=1 Tax=Acinetobacter sp. B51(2017) TaxID=2060938 RepID=UPI000F0912DE|nr:GGDEF domain-containing protein [Acinetobacter sp. B51(2017)]
MFKLRSERIRMHLQVSILVVVLCLMGLAVPWIVTSYRDYQQAKHTVLELQALVAMSNFSEAMLAERLPSNRLNHSPQDSQLKYQLQLQQYRNYVDLKLQRTIHALQIAGFDEIADKARRQTVPALLQARTSFDNYVKQPRAERKIEQLNEEIQKLFTVWDQVNALLKQTLIASHAYGHDTTNHYAMILITCDLQDDASRIVSYIKAPLTFNQPINEQQISQTLQTYNRSKYLWNLIANIQPNQERNLEFEHLHRRIETDFLAPSQLMIATVLQESKTGQSYSYSSQQVTELAVNNFTVIFDLQRYILNKRLEIVETRKHDTQQVFIFSCLVAMVCLLALLFTFFYARYQVFLPLILARNMLLDLIDPECKRVLNNSLTIIDAIEKMKETLKQRDALAFQLKNLANTDALTGVSNRVALEEYLNLKAYQEQPFEHTALIVLDIDNFKQVNDQYGHLVGDDVIRHIAEQLKANVRNSDLVVRYGGDEFLVILENCASGAALYIADQMRCAISHTPVNVEGHPSLYVSVSAGVAVGADSWKALLDKADQSLLRVKASGKNAVEGNT